MNENKQIPSVEHDEEADALYVLLGAGEIAKTKNFGDLRMVDYAADGTVIGVEFLNVSDGIELDELPCEEQLAELIAPLNLKVFA